MCETCLQMMQQVQSDPKVPQLQVMRKQVSRILQRFTTKRYCLRSMGLVPTFLVFLLPGGQTHWLHQHGQSSMTH